jgi:hypothetical protein
MKKLLLILFSLFLCCYSFAEEPNNKSPKHEEFIFGFDSGILSFGISYNTGNTFIFDINANLANLYFENITTGLGIEFFPINYSYSINTNKHLLSLSKLYLYWNLDEILGLNTASGNDYGEKIIWGPFFSIQTLNINDFNNFNTNISYSAGLKFARKEYYDNEYYETRITRGRNGRITFFSSNIELGYNYSNEIHSIYFTIGLSPAYTLFIPGVYLLLAIQGMGD